MTKLDDMRRKILAKNGKQEAIAAIDSYDRIAKMKREAEGRDISSLLEAVATRGKGTSFVDWVDAALCRTTELYPEFIRILYRMTIVPAPGLQTCALDTGARLYIDPALKDGFDDVPAYTVGELSYVIAHECLHWMEEHFDRAQAMNATGDVANIGADLEIESSLLEDVARSGIYRERGSHERVRDWAHIRSPKPGGVWSMPRFTSWPRQKTFEWYYEKLKAEADAEAEKKKPPPQDKDEQDEQEPQQDVDETDDGDGDEGDAEGGEEGDGDEGDAEGGEEGDGDEGDNDSDGAGDGDGDGEGEGEGEARAGSGSGAGKPSQEPWDGKPIQCKPHRGDHGSVVDGIARDYELPAPDGDKIPGVTPIEAEGIRREIAADILEGIGRGVGSLGARRMADRILSVPQVSWESRLGAVLQDSTDDPRSGSTDYTWARRARRQSATPDFILPGMETFAPSLVIVRDTSGSMSSEMLGAANKHADMILMALDLDGVHVIDCDGSAFTAKLVRSLSDYQPTGGGGTDMRVGISAALTIAPRPKTIGVFTDGDTLWPTRAPDGVRIFVVLVPMNGQRKVSPSLVKAVPSWITTIVAEPHAVAR
jgi:predicted metal-dependent peptidase